MNNTLLVNRVKQHPWLAEVLAGLAGLAYVLQSWQYSQTRDSVLDEGLYLLKGYLFISGEYRPFQANGVLTNHMPLSFLIPGFFQAVFGPGLRTGRMYAILVSLLFFLGTWLMVRNLAGRWWAAVAACTLAMNPMMIKTYSLAVSQGLVAFLLVWTLFFGVGKDRRPWQILLGSFLSGVLLMTRLNMAPVLIFLLIYILWRFGLRLGILAGIVGVLPVLWGHILYYPEIMVLWVKWFPADLTPFLSRWRFEGMNQLPETGITTIIRLKSLFQGFSLHALPWVAILVSWVLWPSQWDRIDQGNATLFSALYTLLLAIHTWATLAGSHCVFCFSWYQYFFEILSILVVVVTWGTWRWSLSPWRKGLAWILILVVLLALVLGGVLWINRAAPSAADALITGLMEMPVPRFVDGRIAPGRIALWGLIANKFELMHRFSYDQAYQQVEHWLWALVVFAASGVFLFSTWWLAGWFRGIDLVDRAKPSEVDRSGLALRIILMGCWLLMPLGILGGNSDSYDCEFNTIETYEAAGKQLAEQVPPGSKVFWWGGDTQAALLYLQDVEFYPALFNASFANRIGDPVELERYGLWNDQLIQEWAKGADVILVEERLYSGWLTDYVTTAVFNELGTTGEMGCRGQTNLHVYMRAP